MIAPSTNITRAKLSNGVPHLAPMPTPNINAPIAEADCASGTDLDF